jgi:uncharacterized membrane protein
MNTRGPTPNKPASAKATARQEQMPKKGTRPLAMDAAEGSIVVKAPIAAVYKRWLEFEDYPKFITAIKRVRKLDTNHFVALLAFNGKQHEAMLEIMLRVPERRLAWRTVSNGHAPDHLAAGVVSFASCSDRTTCITFKLTSSFGGAVSRRVDRYLHNFKRLIEERELEDA